MHTSMGLSFPKAEHLMKFGAVEIAAMIQDAFFEIGVSVETNSLK